MFVFWLICLKTQILDLQNEIASMSVPVGQDGTVKFSDICHRPEGSSDCVITSVLNYFQNNGTNLNKVAYDTSGKYVAADYHDHFLNCTQ